MNSMIYIYLGVVMIVVLTTTFYVRTIKNKLDTKVDAMFQLVQSLVAEVQMLKSKSVMSPPSIQISLTRRDEIN